MAEEFKDLAIFGMVDVMDSEILKETFKIKTSPWFGLFTNGSFHIYEGPREKPNVKQFIEKDHGNFKKGEPIPELYGRWAMYYVYLDRYLIEHLPIWNKELDAMIFKQLNLDHLSVVQKISIAAAVLSVMTSMCIISMACLCCNIRTVDKRQKGKDINGSAKKNQ